MVALAVTLVIASGSPFHVDWAEDGIITGTTTIIYLMGEQVVKPGMVGARACRRITNDVCDPDSLNAIDRSVIDNDAPGWATASQWLLYSTYALTLGATAIDAANDTGNRADSWGRDAIVLSESMVVTQLATNVLKYSLRRARPTQYRPNTDVSLVEEQLSFPSGHTSGVAAAATTYAYAFAERHPHDSARFAVYGVGAALTLVTGYARTAAGRHFYSDVLAGAAIGVLIGYIVPHPHHPQNDDTRSTFAPTTGLRGPPVITFGGRF